MEKTRKEVYKQLGREDLLESVYEYTGDEVAQHIKDITPEEGDIPEYFINKYIKPNDGWKMTDIKLKDLLKDKDFKEYYNSGEERYDDDEIAGDDLYNELVVYKGQLLDGYSRASKMLRDGEKTAGAFVLESVIDERKEYVGRYNTVKKVIAKIGRRPSEQEVATFITNNYYDVTEVERGWDDPQANDKIADLVAFYKFDIDDWNIAWTDAQNESLVIEAKFNLKAIGLARWYIKTQDRMSEEDIIDALVNDDGYDRNDVEGWMNNNYDKLKESLVTEASTDRMIKQIKRALKDGLSIFKLPMATQKYYAKNKSDFETVEEALLEKGYNMDDIHDLIAHHRFDKDFKKLSSKDKEWVENDAKERGFNESLLESEMYNMFYSLIDELYEAKPGPDAYMTGLSDEEKEEKEAKMKKQAEMDDDDPDSYEELPGDEEAREKGKVKKSKHTTAYNKKFKSEGMKNLKSYDNFVTEKRSDLWSPFQKADILAGDMFGAMGLYRLEDDELDQIIDLKKADKLAKKMFGEFGFKTLAAKEMEDLLDNNPELLRESVVNEFGPMRGSGNRDYSTSDLVDRIGELDDILMSDRKAEREWEEMSQNYLDGEKGSEYWADLGDQELQDAIDDAESLMKKYRIKESVVTEAKPAGLSKEETLKVAQKFADALTKLDGKKYTVSSDYEEDSFDLDFDGEEYAGGSYNINADGSVVNMAVWNKSNVSPTYGNMDDDIKTIIKTIKNIKESVVTEAKVNYNFSEDELKRVLKLLGRSASTEVKMIKAFEKAFGRKLTRDEMFELAVTVTEAKNTIGLAFKDEDDYNDFVEFCKDEGVKIRKDLGEDKKTKSWSVEMDVKELEELYGEITPGNKNSGWLSIKDDFDSVIIESVVNEAEKYVTDEFKVGDKIKTNFGEWEVIETDYAPRKSFKAPFIFKGKDMKRVDIPNPPKTNKNAVGYKVTDGDKYPIIGFLYQYQGGVSGNLITKLATVGVDESIVNEEKIKYAKGKTYQSSGHWTVMVDSNSSMCDIRVNSSAGWRLDPHDDREETWELLDGGRQRATIYFRRGSIDKFAQQMFDLNDRTTWGNKTLLTAKDYADIIRVWIDMKKANESRNTGIFSDMVQDFEDFVTEKKSLNEASRRKVHKAAKQGSYPAVIVVVQDGKVIHQEPVSTPDVAPATFNVMQEKYPKAILHLEDNTGKRLFSESVVNEAKFFRLPAKLNAMWELKNSVDYIVGKHDNGDDYKPEEMKTIEEFIKKIKQSAKAFKSAEEVEGTVYESVVTEAKGGQIMPGDYVKTQYGDIYLRVDGKVGKSDAYVRVTKGKAGKKKTGLHDSMKLTLVENRMLRKGQFRFGAKLQYGIEDVNESYGFYGTLMDQFGLDEVNELFLDGFSLLGTQYDFTDQAALYYLNSKAGRWVADQVTEKLVGAKNMSPYYGHLEEIFAEYAKKGQWKKWSKEYDQYAEEDNMEEGLMIRESKSDMDEYYRGLLEAEQTTNDQSSLGDDGMETGIKNKSKESGVPVGLLRIIMRRGLAAWKTGHRPGATQAQWGYARVNSFLTKQPGTWGKADSDIAKKVRDGGHDKDL